MLKLMKVMLTNIKNKWNSLLAQQWQDKCLKYRHWKSYLSATDRTADQLLSDYKMKDAEEEESRRRKRRGRIKKKKYSKRRRRKREEWRCGCDVAVKVKMEMRRSCCLFKEIPYRLLINHCVSWSHSGFKRLGSETNRRLLCLGIPQLLPVVERPQHICGVNRWILALSSTPSTPPLAAPASPVYALEHNKRSACAWLRACALNAKSKHVTLLGNIWGWVCMYAQIDGCMYLWRLDWWVMFM